MSSHTADYMWALLVPRRRDNKINPTWGSRTVQICIKFPQLHFRLLSPWPSSHQLIHDVIKFIKFAPMIVRGRSAVQSSQVPPRALLETSLQNMIWELLRRAVEWRNNKEDCQWIVLCAVRNNDEIWRCWLVVSSTPMALGAVDSRGTLRSHGLDTDYWEVRRLIWLQFDFFKVR